MAAPTYGPMPAALGYRQILSVSDYFYPRAGLPTPPNPQYTVADICRLDFFMNNHINPKIDTDWNTPSYGGAISPILFSCYNRSIDSYGVSHEGAGVNAVYLDGHARWVSRAEVVRDSGEPAYNAAAYYTPYGSLSVLNTYYPYGGTFAVWARRFAKLD